MTTNNFLKGKNVLITGVCGTVGSELIDELVCGDYGASRIVAIDNNESELFYLSQKYKNHSSVNLKLCDVRDAMALEQIIAGIDIIFHVAAFKHVVMCETSPMEAIQTNILSTQNIITIARRAKVEKVIFASTDKAVNPTNVMGVSKLMSEKLMTAANSQEGSQTVFSSTRFGNVLGSNGSVLPLFLHQLEYNKELTLTDERMTRFIMSNKQAVRLLIDSAYLARGGEVFVTKMPSIKIIDLAQAVIDLAAGQFGHRPQDIKLTTIGSKPGEKLYEELMSEEEITRAYELVNYFVVLPAFRDMYKDINYDYEGIKSKVVTNPYVSNKEEYMSLDGLKSFLKTCELI